MSQKFAKVYKTCSFFSAKIGNFVVFLSSPIFAQYVKMVGTAVAQWLRGCATNRKVAGSIPDGVTGIFYWHNPSDRTKVLGSTQSNRNEYQENFLGGKCGRCVRLTTLPPPCAVVMKSGNLKFMEPSGPLQACNGTDLPFLPLTCITHYVKIERNT